MEKEEVKRKPINARVYAMDSVNTTCAYIVAFSQEVKCKAICFSCCRKNRYGIESIKYSQPGHLKVDLVCDKFTSTTDNHIVGKDHVSS